VISRECYSDRCCGIVNDSAFTLAIFVQCVHSLPHDLHFYFETHCESRSIT